MRIALAAVVLLSACSPALAGDFNPEKYGLGEIRSGAMGAPGLECHELRVAEGGRNKVWKCSDGRQFFGPEDVWSRPATPPYDPQSKKVVLPPAVELPTGKAMLTLRHWVNDRYCSGKASSCRGREVVSVSHLVVDKDQCEAMGEQLAYDDYVNSGRPDSRIKISWDCK